MANTSTSASSKPKALSCTSASTQSAPLPMVAGAAT